MARKRTKYKHRFDVLVINNRWKQPRYSRTGTWVIFGISTRYFSTSEYEYCLSFFGLDLRFWFLRTPLYPLK